MAAVFFIRDGSSYFRFGVKLHTVLSIVAGAIPFGYSIY
jgi:hypothetical protein